LPSSEWEAWGHLGIQFAAKLGFRTVAIARGTDKEQLAREMGAHAYIDSTAGNPGEALQAMGGAKAILSTISSGGANTEVIEGLAPAASS
jgi:D-arabinose 1-dehydrogenase-like Zn-dependent alcohol dehydrogenase